MNRFTRVNFRLAAWALAVVMLLGIWGHWATISAGDAPELVVQEVETVQSESFGQLIFKWPESTGEWAAFGFYLVLLTFSLAAMTIALERAVHLRRVLVMPTGFVEGMRDLVRRKADTAENLRSLCDGSSSPVANILKAGTLRAGRPLPEVEKGMEDAAAREMATMHGRNRPLSVIGSVSPLVGLLGTVVGMIFAFRVSSQAGLGRAELLAEGIYMALLTTAAGLTIAIPSLLLAAWFNGRAELFMRNIDEILLETLPGFTRMEAAGSGNSASGNPSPERSPDHATSPS